MNNDAINITSGSALSAVQLDWVHGLNTAHEAKLSAETLQSMADLFARATFTALAEPEAGFVMCVDETVHWPGPNYAWMKNRYDRFFYVDRIAIDDAHHGSGLGRRLYDAAMAAARSAGHANFVCEVNTNPPNAASLAFHNRLGFTRIGAATHKAPLYGPADKTVAYLHFAL